MIDNKKKTKQVIKMSTYPKYLDKPACTRNKQKDKPCAAKTAFQALKIALEKGKISVTGEFKKDLEIYNLLFLLLRLPDH